MASETSKTVQEGAERQNPKAPLAVTTAIPGRNRPLLTGRQPGGLGNNHSDFFTDSLNTSYIPTPSPTKASARPSSATSRQPVVVNHNARPNTAAGSRNSGGLKHNENKIPSFESSTSSSDSKKTTTPTPRRSSFVTRETASSLAKKTTPPGKTGEVSPRVKRNSIGSIRERQQTRIPTRPDSSLSRPASSLSRPESSFSLRESIRTSIPSPTKSRHKSLASDMVIRSRTPSPRKTESTIPTLRSRTPSPTKNRQESLQSPESYTEAHTPSPPRRLTRQDSLVSPISSASSPPQGLAESYQRIEDEEFLAGQEGDHEDDLNFSEGDFTMDQSENLDPFRGQPTGSGSPNFRHSSKSSLRNVVSNSSTHERHTNSTPSDDGSSRLNDTFNMPLGYATDEDRLKAALSERVVAFRKSSSRPSQERAGLTAENLQRKDAASPTKSGSSTLGSPSVSSRTSEPPYNIPDRWGRKPRGDAYWLNRVDRSGGKFTGDVSKSRSLKTGTVSEPGDRAISPVGDWISAASDLPAPSVENESTDSYLLPSRGSSSNLRRQTSLGQIRESEANDDDATGTFSRTERTRRNAALDQIREREFETLAIAKSGVTTNRLGELREKKSLDAVRRRSPNISGDLLRKDGREEMEQRRMEWSSSPEKQLKPKPVARAEVSTYVESDRSDNPTTNKPENQASKLEVSKSEKTKETQPSARPDYDRQESRELLRTLTTATSLGGSPARATELDTTKALNDSKESKLNAEAPQLSEQRLYESDAGHGKNIVKKDFRSQSTPQQPKQDLPSKTPTVTGHWIDTPLAAGRGLPMPTPNDTEDEKELDDNIDAAMINLGAKDIAEILQGERLQGASLADTAPKLPKSALSAILEKAKNKKAIPRLEQGSSEDDTLNLDDSTIQSLEDIVARSDDSNHIQTHPPAMTPPVAEQDFLPSKAPKRPSTRDTSPEEEEDFDTGNLMERLRRASFSLKDAKTGLGSLERLVASTSTKGKDVAKPKTDDCNEGGELHDFLWPCDKCGCTGSSPTPIIELKSGEGVDWHVVRLPIPRIWYWKKGDRLPRFTWTGLVLFTVTALLVGERHC
ncbi:MAG: hypothetical protein MMC33_007134 [Icmadophila ericetorum]|nr:hypothetical protein [Icmadophila ericetorum]